MTEIQYERERFFGQIYRGQTVRSLRWKFNTSDTIWTEYFVQRGYHPAALDQACAFKRIFESYCTFLEEKEWELT